MRRNEGWAGSASDGTVLMREALEAWAQKREFRRERERCKDYTFGRQWGDTIRYEGRIITEEDYIRSMGHEPLKNNLIRRIVRNVLGVFRRQLAEKMEEMEEPIRSHAALNSLYELYSRTMEEFLISGVAIHKKWVGLRNGRRGVWTDAVCPAGFFYNADATDSRGEDFTLVGEIHDVSFGEYCDAFVRTPYDYERVSYAFSGNMRRRVRVLEVWRRERRSRRIVHDTEAGRVWLMEERDWERSRRFRGMRSRWVLDDVWRYYFIDGEGRVLREGDSPYPHGSHPYVFKGYPFLDGEIHSFVSDTIDQQRYTNRLISMYDWVMRASAKGVLLLPEGCVDPGDMQGVADEWSKFNGVIVYRHKPGDAEPRQVTGSAGNLGIGELLNIQLKMLEDVSGVNGALQGNVQSNSVSGTLYSKQTENALTSLSDLLDTFASFISACTNKDRALLTSLRPRRGGQEA